MTGDCTPAHKKLILALSATYSQPAHGQAPDLHENTRCPRNPSTGSRNQLCHKKLAAAAWQTRCPGSNLNKHTKLAEVLLHATCSPYKTLYAGAVSVKCGLQAPCHYVVAYIYMQPPATLWHSYAKLLSEAGGIKQMHLMQSNGGRT